MPLYPTNASSLVPEGWLARVMITTTRNVPDFRVDVWDRPTNVRLAAIIPDPTPRLRDHWLLADGNDVTRWSTFRDALLYGARPRGAASAFGERTRRLIGHAPDFRNCLGSPEGWEDNPVMVTLFDSTSFDPWERV